MTQHHLTGYVSRRRNTVHHERHLDVPPERVWAAWTDPDRLAGWLGAVESGAPGPAGTFVVRMDDDQTVSCTVDTWDPPRLLELTWTYSGEDPSRLRLELRATATGTHLILDHHLPTGADLLDYGAGWHIHLDSLTTELAGRRRATETEGFGALRAAYDAAATD